jgi:hypothetical protein
VACRLELNPKQLLSPKQQPPPRATTPRISDGATTVGSNPEPLDAESKSLANPAPGSSEPREIYAAATPNRALGGADPGGWEEEGREVLALTEPVLDEVVEGVAVAVVGELVVRRRELLQALRRDGGEVAGELRVLGEHHGAPRHERVDQRLLPHRLPPDSPPVERRNWGRRMGKGGRGWGNGGVESKEGETELSRSRWVGVSRLGPRRTAESRVRAPRRLDCSKRLSVPPRRCYA